jgi:hypothetical protein
MPLILIGKSFMLLLLIPITQFLRPVYDWQGRLPAVGRPWPWLFFRMAKNDRCPSLRRI